MKQNTRQILVIILGFAALAVLFRSPWLLLLSGGIGLASLLSQRMMTIIVQVWFRVSAALAWVNTRVLLTLVFFLLLTPLGVLYRLTRRNPLQLKRPAGSNYHRREHTFTGEDLENVW